ncbi:EthD domain-containing protein [Aspergillus cavernicola]|uniref:EthD domain-containing protein n=1 Tax=Aspergillus cavernicola TaxID=176166 RepID=A0ABR4ISP0_9EURO
MSFPDPPERTSPNDKILCLTILGYRKEGMSEEDYRHHMTQVSAPLTWDLMVKYGILRWTQIHNTTSTRNLMYQIMDPQMANIADYDCFSQVVFRSFEDYKRIKEDPWYKEHLVGDHENFADTKRSKMTIGWISQFVDKGVVVDGFPEFPKA